MSINWVECNLSFSCPTELLGASSPNLTEREKQELGQTDAEVFERYLAEAMSEDEFQDWDEKYMEWYNSQPEVIKYNDDMAKSLENTFVGKGLNRPGTLVELEDGSQFLIGSDCYLNIASDAIIKRYANVLNEDVQIGSDFRQVVNNLKLGTETDQLFADGLSRVKSDLMTAKLMSHDVFGAGVNENTIFGVYDLVVAERIAALYSQALQKGDHKQAETYYQDLRRIKSGSNVN